MSRVLSPVRYCLIAILFVALSCGKTDPTPPPPAPNPNPTPTPTPPPPPTSSLSQKEITSFVFRSADNASLVADVNGTIGLDTIKLVVSGNLPLINLVPSIGFKGHSISPQGSVPRDFSQPLNYTVTADDSSKKKYIVTVVYQSLAATIFLNTINIKPSASPSNKGYLYAIDPATGSLRWKYQPGDNGFYGSPAFSNNILYTANRETVIAMDVTTRAIKWKYKTCQVVQTSLLLANGALYINSSDGTFYAFDPATGNLKWKTTYNGGGTGNAQSSPTFVDGTLYCGGTQAAIFALNADDGSIKWKTRFPSIQVDEVISSPIVVNSVLYVGDAAGNVLALNTNDGSVKWSFKGQGAIISSPTVVNGIVYLGDSHYLYAFDAMTGSLRWQFAADAGVSGSPLVLNGLVYFAGTNIANQCKMYAVDASTGVQKWQYTHPPGADYVNPVAFNGNVYFDIKSDLVSLDAATGNLKWVFHADYVNEDTWGAPCIVDEKGNVYYSSESGNQQ